MTPDEVVAIAKPLLAAGRDALWRQSGSTTRLVRVDDLGDAAGDRTHGPFLIADAGLDPGPDWLVLPVGTFRSLQVPTVSHGALTMGELAVKYDAARPAESNGLADYLRWSEPFRAVLRAGVRVVWADGTSRPVDVRYSTGAARLFASGIDWIQEGVPDQAFRPIGPSVS